MANSLVRLAAVMLGVAVVGALAGAQSISGGASGISSLSGDCTASGPGAVTVNCTKTQGTPYAASATVNTVNAANITTGLLDWNRLPMPTTTSMGGVVSVMPVSHNFVQGVDTQGVPILAQPAAGDVSGLAPIATSGSASDLSTGTVPSTRGGAGAVSGIMKASGGIVSGAVSATDYAPATVGTPILKGNGSGGFASAVSSTDYAPATSGTSILKGNGSGGFSSAVAGTDYGKVDLVGTTSAIGGGLLGVGSCTSGTATVTGATVGMAAVSSPTTYPGDGAQWQTYVSAPNTVTVKVCALILLTPVSTTYNVRVIQ